MGAIAWDAFTWEAFATLVTGVLAVGAAAWVGHRQARILRKQAEIQAAQARTEAQRLRFEMYEPRNAALARARNLMNKVDSQSVEKALILTGTERIEVTIALKALFSENQEMMQEIEAWQKGLNDLGQKVLQAVRLEARRKTYNYPLSQEDISNENARTTLNSEICDQIEELDKAYRALEQKAIELMRIDRPA